MFCVREGDLPHSWKQVYRVAIAIPLVARLGTAHLKLKVHRSISLKLNWFYAPIMLDIIAFLFTFSETQPPFHATRHAGHGRNEERSANGSAHIIYSVDRNRIHLSYCIIIVNILSQYYLNYVEKYYLHILFVLNGEGSCFIVIFW